MTLTLESFAIRAAALELLETHRVQLERSRILLERARALCSRVDAASFAAPSLSAASPAEAGAVPARRRPGSGCTLRGCARPAPYQPCFIVDTGRFRVVVRDMPVRVCAEHRADLGALFRRPTALRALAEHLRGRGHEAPDSVRVLFEVVGRGAEPRTS